MPSSESLAAVSCCHNTRILCCPMCSQNTGRLDDMEDFVAAIVDLGKLQGWNPARSLQVFCSINKEGLLYIQQPGNE